MMPFKRIASKDKKHASREQGQTSNANQRPNQPHSQQQIISPEDRQRLLQNLKEEDLEWMLNNPNLPIHKFIEGKLSGGPIELSGNEVNVAPYLQNPDDGLPEPEYRWCKGCNLQEERDVMAKCRVCFYWYCTWHEGKVIREGRNDARFRFWKCSNCRSVFLGGINPNNATQAKVETDNQFEDQCAF